MHRDVIARVCRHPVADVTVAFVGSVATVVDVVASVVHDDAPTVVAEELQERVASGRDCARRRKERKLLRNLQKMQ